MVSLRWGFVSFPTGGETASRKRQQPSQADLQARRVQNVAQPTASDPAAIATFDNHHRDRTTSDFSFRHGPIGPV
jgi:hypothetical protein